MADADEAMWTSISVRPDHYYEYRYEGVLVGGGSVSFNSRKGFRGDFIGLLYDDYTLSLQMGSNAAPLAVRRVSISPERESAVVDMSVP